MCYKNAPLRSFSYKYILSALRIFTAHISIGCLIVNSKTIRPSDTLKFTGLSEDGGRADF